ncbi:MAG TPA: thiamine pyrophosphate-dependent dehydrogenase E1 component subunit alpha [Candidatus Acidoferrales bacterium]|nr:thiamine pyrophosphate-dependent dehydrogenase E1 component subunit alpha [Candidatus Acidoferrales bacterium]
MSSSEFSLNLLWEMYRTMLRIRIFEERLAELIEAGEVKTPCHLYIGQEAIAAGVCATLQKSDYVWGGHRSHGHYIAKGGELKSLMAEIFGKSTGCSHGRGGSMHLFSAEVGILGTVPLVGATIPLAVGTALSSQMRRDGRVSVTFFGDGATEEGHFHESLNLAALYKLPVLLICENNWYASHMRLLDRRAADDIAESARKHAMPSSLVDGNDAIVVHQAAEEAVARARRGDGPTLLECRTYRWRGHVGPSWDMDVGVRRSDELKEWLPRDPIARMRSELVGRGVGSDPMQQLEDEIRVEVEEAVDFARRSPYPGRGGLHDHVFRDQLEGG